MPPIEYLGEHRWIGHVLHASVIIGFLASLNAIIAYSKSVRNPASPWMKYGRMAFYLQGLMVFATIFLIFFAMLNHYYEYEYVRHHISDDLPFKYIFAAFWEGQEGSFLLWMFWNVILGFILIRKSGPWEAPVMALFATLQVLLFSMLLGIHIGWGEHLVKLGSSPSLLVRETFTAPIFENPNYVSLLKGNGLNPLLQNYWMTIHPPTLFLGFSSTIVPFLFAFAGWWKNEPKAWLKPAQEWALFAVFILGLGILMGGAWAYEALSFGGYWAWDPVENMSLVPWIMLLAGLHTNMIARSTGRAVGTTYIYYALAFILVLYSTYLTRSGVLGDTSAHAFTDMGLEWQLILMIVVFTFLSAYQYLTKRKLVASNSEEEKIYSREYWMFIGAMVLLFSAILITGATSLPVFNKIIKAISPEYLGSVIVDPISHHNKFQLWIGVLVGLISGSAEFLRFKETRWAEYKPRFLKLMGSSLAITAGLFLLTMRLLNEPSWQHLVLQFAGIFALVSNLAYLFTFLRGKLKLAGSALAHFGFGMMLLGILATGLNKQIISSNLFAQSDLLEGFSTEDYMRNLALIKGAPMPIKDYEVTWMSDTLLDPFNRQFQIRFDHKDESGRVIKKINVSPTLIYNRNEAQPPSSNPSIYRGLLKDLYTFVNWLPPAMMNREAAAKIEDSLRYIPHLVAVGDTLFFSGGYGVLLSVDDSARVPEYKAEPGDQVLRASVQFHRLNDTGSYLLQSVIVSRENYYFSLPQTQNDLALKVRISPLSLENFYPSSLEGDDLELKENQSGKIRGYQLRFLGFDKDPAPSRYASRPNDVAVATRLEISSPDGAVRLAEPLFVIRDNQVFLVPDYILDQALKVSCIKIDPQKESVLIRLYESVENKIQLELAENAPRNDMIVIQSILFPGINLFWLGSFLMLGGVLLSGVRRWINR
ncbi:MAG TPA: cytochrome c biogenesis protein CcsA [Saprospiraceae bacterium]|nr:cytochrome c biogenesis protein CcsA [Saprospiraceae bacterium]HNT18905.1 cytochrome c biogenesis protein CcsA [Saprospiraceae bacterium]